VRSRVLKKTVLAAVVVAMQTQILQMALRLKITRRFSLKCCFLGHEDWIRRTSDRLSLECFECGRKTRGWTTGRITSRRAGDAVQGEPVNKPNDHSSPFSRLDGYNILVVTFVVLFNHTASFTQGQVGSTK